MSKITLSTETQKGVVVDNVLYTKDVFVLGEEDIKGGILKDHPGSVLLSVFDRDASLKILTHCFSDLPEKALRIDLYPDLHLVNEKLVRHNITLNRKASGGHAVSVKVHFNIYSWNKVWSANEYQSELVKVIQEQQLATEFADISAEKSTTETDIFLPSSDLAEVISAHIEKYKPHLQQLHELTEASLTAKFQGESVVTVFNFPEEVRVPCEQYLLYFVQFLKDIGVDATAELQHQAGQVLFAVTPTDKDEALDNIRAALDTYLRLAASPVNTASVLSTDIEVQRLSANIQHLQGQLTLAHAVLQAKDATIQFQQTTIAQQRQMLTGEIVLESMKDVTPKPKDSEEVLGGLAEITKYEGKGFNLNLPEAFRRLRQLFIEKKGGNK